MMDQMRIKRYLEHIHCEGAEEVSLMNLAKLHWKHILYVPYENLDIINGVALSLDNDDLYSKIVERNRGGYCFELQGAFGYLLKSLGYKVTQYAGRFMNEPWHIQMRRHRILVVDLDGKRYVCDVAQRQEAPRIPLELSEGLIQTDGICEYRYEKDSFYGWVLWQKEAEKEWKALLGFTEEVQIDEDYVMPSFYCEQHPDSTFNKYMKVGIFTEDSSVTLVENTFKVYRSGTIVERRELKDNAEAIELLRKVFKIDVPVHYGTFLWKK